MTSVNVWERTDVADRFDEIIENSKNMDLVLAQIPGLFGDSQKATYLGFRAIGLTLDQALEVLGCDIMDYQRWKEETPEFVEFELRCLYEIQSKIGADIIRLGFMRNMTMFMFRDQMTIRKSLTGFDSMDPREFNYLKVIRKHYSNQDLLALEKAIAPERHRNNTLVLSFGEQAFEIVDGEVDGNQIKLVEEAREQLKRAD